MGLFAWLALLVACDGSKGDSACAPLEGTADCPVDACAETCPSEAEAVACCLAAHGRGVTDPDDRARLAGGCPAVDPEALLSAAAALCVAQAAAGLEPGIAGCYASLDCAEDSPSWLVHNTLSRDCPEDTGYGESVGDFLQIDALTGEVGGGGTTFTAFECE